MYQQGHQRKHLVLTDNERDFLTIAALIEYGNYSRTSSRNSPEMFDYPGLAAQLYTIAQAVHFPAEYMAHVLQIAELGQWKNIQDNNGTLSYRELARRGKNIEYVLLGQLLPSSGYVN